MKISHITFDSQNAITHAGFWATVLGWDVAPKSHEGFAAVGGPNRPENTPTLLFLQVPEGKTAKNRVHLDLETQDLEETKTQLLAMGATFVHEKHEYGAHWMTFQDPEGNEFCVADGTG